VNRFVHRHDVCRRCVGLDIVARIADPAGAAIDFDALANLGGNFIDRAERQGVLVVDRTVKDDPLAKVGDQALALHAGAPPLDRIQGFDADPVDQVRQEQACGTVGVVHHVNPVGTGQVGHLDLVGQQEPAVHRQTHQRPGLRAQVLGDPGQVDSSAAGFKTTALVFVVEIKNVAQDRLGQLGPQHQVLERTFQAAQIAVQQKRFVTARMNRPITVVGVQRSGNHGVVEIVGIGPAVGIHVGHGFGGGQRAPGRFVIGARSVVHPLEPHAPHVRLRIVGMMRQPPLRLDVSAAVDMKFPPQGFFGGAIQIVQQPPGHFAGGLIIGRNPIDRLPVQQCQPALAGCHFHLAASSQQGACGQGLRRTEFKIGGVAASPRLGRLTANFEFCTSEPILVHRPCFATGGGLLYQLPRKRLPFIPL
jgi:hypothetical protein